MYFASDSRPSQHMNGSPQTFVCYANEGDEKQQQQQQQQQQQRHRQQHRWRTVTPPIGEEPDWSCYEGQPEELTRAVCAWLMSTAPPKATYGSDVHTRIAAGEERLAKLVHTLSAAGLDIGTPATEMHIDKYCAWLQACYFDGVSTSDHGSEARRRARHNNQLIEQLCSQQHFASLATKLQLAAGPTNVAAAIAEAEAISQQLADLEARLAAAKAEGQQLTDLLSRIQRKQCTISNDNDASGDGDDNDLGLAALWPEDGHDGSLNASGEEKVKHPEKKLQAEDDAGAHATSIDGTVDHSQTSQAVAGTQFSQQREERAQNAASMATRAQSAAVAAHLVQILSGLLANDARQEYHQQRSQILQQQQLQRQRQRERWHFEQEKAKQRQAHIAAAIAMAQRDATQQWYQHQGHFLRQELLRRQWQAQAQVAHAAAAQLAGCCGHLGRTVSPLQRQYGPQWPWRWQMAPYSAPEFPFHTVAVLG